MIKALKKAQLKQKEEGFTLIELIIVVVIIGILAAIAIPVFANQQKSTIVAGIKSDVKNTNANLAKAFSQNPNAPIASLLSAATVTSDTDTIITASGTWDNYYILATNKNIGTAATITTGSDSTTVTTPEVIKYANVVNPNFDTDVSGWKLNGTVTHETADPINGVGSAKISGTTPIQQTVKTPYAAQDKITVTIKYRTAGAGSISPYQSRLYSQSESNSTKYPLVFGDSSVKTATLSYTTKEGGTGIDVWVYGSNDGGIVFIDDVEVKITTPAKSTVIAGAEGYNLSTSGSGVFYSSTSGKIVSRNN